MAVWSHQFTTARTSDFAIRKPIALGRCRRGFHYSQEQHAGVKTRIVFSEDRRIIGLRLCPSNGHTGETHRQAKRLHAADESGFLRAGKVTSFSPDSASLPCCDSLPS